MKENFINREKENLRAQIIPMYDEWNRLHYRCQQLECNDTSEVSNNDFTSAFYSINKRWTLNMQITLDSAYALSFKSEIVNQINKVHDKDSAAKILQHFLEGKAISDINNIRRKILLEETKLNRLRIALENNDSIDSMK